MVINGYVLTLVMFLLVKSGTVMLKDVVIVSNPSSSPPWPKVIFTKPHSPSTGKINKFNASKIM